MNDEAPYRRRRAHDDVIIGIAQDVGTMQGKLDSLINRLDPVLTQVDEHGAQINRARGYVMAATGLGGGSLVIHILKWVGILADHPK